MCSMGEHGSPYPRFRRALTTGNPVLVTSAALELGRLSLADALAVCLVFGDHEPERFDRAAVRWLARLCRETPGLALRDVGLAVAALPALTGPGRAAAAATLGALAEGYRLDDVAEVLDEWLTRRGAPTPAAD